MILRFTPPLPCDVRTKSGALCGQASAIGFVRATADGWRIVPICPACARRLALAAVQPKHAA
jgi:hypothetical protein